MRIQGKHVEGKSDVDGTDPVDGDVLTYSASTKEWKGAQPSGGATETEIDLPLKLNSGGGVVATRKAMLTKIGNLVTMVVEPVGKYDNSELIDATGERLVVDAGTIPADYRMANPDLYVTVPFNCRDDGVWGEGFMYVGTDGSVGISKTRQSGSFTGNIFSYDFIVASWSTADFS